MVFSYPLSALIPGLAAAVLAVLVPVPSAAALPPPPLDRARYMGVSEVRPGMTGYGLSVFHGSRIDTFRVEILAVRKNYFPQSDMILARGSGAGLEKSGIVAGMSGSPIYLDGRLAGALAFGWEFMTEPIMGITPIESMLPVTAAAAADDDAGASGGAATPEGRAAWRQLLVSRGEAARPLVEALLPPPTGESAGGEGRPIDTPLWLSGFDPGLVPGMTDWLAPRGLKPLLSGGAGSDGEPLGPEALVPGAAVAVELVKGDASASAIGTVTWREGDRILAFGHPMFHRGHSAYPMATATIETIMPKLDDSFKFGSASGVVGTVDADMRTGIGGAVGPPPPMIPVTVTVDDPLSPGEQVYHYQIMDDETLTGQLAAWVAANSVVARGKQVGNATLDVAATYTLADGRELPMRSTVAGTFPPGSLALEVARPVTALLSNPLEKVRLASVDIRVKIRQSLIRSTLEELRLRSPEPVPGKPMEVVATLRGYRGATTLMPLSIDLPAGLEAGEYTLRVCDGSGFLAWDDHRAPGVYDPQSVDQLLRLLKNEPSDNTLVITLSDSKLGVSAAGEDMGRLPPSALAAFAAPGLAGTFQVTQGSILARRDVPLAGAVEGCAELKIKVPGNLRGFRAPGDQRQ